MFNTNNVFAGYVFDLTTRLQAGLCLLQCFTWHSLRGKKPKLTEVKISIHRRLKSVWQIHACEVLGLYRRLLIKRLPLGKMKNHHHSQSEQRHKGVHMERIKTQNSYT